MRCFFRRDMLVDVYGRKILREGNDVWFYLVGGKVPDA